MASLLRQIVAGPRTRHPEANLDLCYVTDDSVIRLQSVIATSGPSATYPSLAYRTPLADLVAFLDAKHGAEWCLFEFRAEGCGYPDADVYGRIWHWPWPDHHPPPFALVPKILGSMRSWLEGGTSGASNAKDTSAQHKRVAVVHCKAGKGRSGSMAVAYLMVHKGWTKQDAMQRFTERRMRPGFGAGVSIPSQLRWLDYVERWASPGGKMYLERAVEVTEVHVWGLREGVTISVEGFVQEGKKIEAFHIFRAEEADDFAKSPTTKEDEMMPRSRSGLRGAMQEVMKRQATKLSRSRSHSPRDAVGVGSEPSTMETSNANIGVTSATLQVPGEAGSSLGTTDPAKDDSRDNLSQADPTAANVIFRPMKQVRLPSSDINLAVERRATAGYGISTITAVAHVWFNCYFEGNGPENYQRSGSPVPDSGGVFSIDWEAMDGIKGSSRKGARAFDKVAVVWKSCSADCVSGADTSTPASGAGAIVSEPAVGENITPVEPADWRNMGWKSETDSTATHVESSKVSPVGGQIERGAAAGADVEAQGDRAGEAAGEADGEPDEEGVEGLRRGVVASDPDPGLDGEELETGGGSGPDKATP